MSMYDLMFQPCPLAPYLLHGLGLDPRKLGRLRDCYFNEACDRIIVFTRNGGGNRDDHQQEIAYSKDHPLFVKDYDDECDNTYAVFEYKVPKALKDVAKEAKELGLGYKPFKERFDELMAKLKSGNKEDPDVKRAMERFAPLGEALKKSLEGGEGGHTHVITI